MGAFLVLLIWSQPAAWVVLGLVLIIAVVFAVIELLGRASTSEATAADKQAAAVDVDEDPRRPAATRINRCPSAGGHPTAPDKAEGTMRTCAELDIKHVWMHRGPGSGSVSDTATAYGREQRHHRHRRWLPLHVRPNWRLRPQGHADDLQEPRSQDRLTAEGS